MLCHVSIAGGGSRVGKYIASKIETVLGELREVISVTQSAFAGEANKYARVMRTEVLEKNMMMLQCEQCCPLGFA